jgi:hypothetical protein
LDVAEPDEFHIIEEPAKHHGYAVGRQAALDRLNQRSYLQMVPKMGMDVLCHEMDTHLWNSFVENSFRANGTTPITYTYDCDSRQV